MTSIRKWLHYISYLLFYSSRRDLRDTMDDTMDTARLKSMASLPQFLAPFSPRAIARRLCDFQYSYLALSFVFYIVAGRLLPLILCPSRHHPPIGCHHLQYTTQDSLYQIMASLHTSSSRISFLLHGSRPPFYLSFSSHFASNFHRIRHWHL